jgi:hypothetical protein
MSINLPPLPQARLAELVGHYKHRLLSMEADLKDLARRGRLTAKEFSRRIESLKTLQHELLMYEELGSKQNAKQDDLALPLLEHASPAEKQTCAKFFYRRVEWSDSIFRQMKRVCGWLDAIVTGRANFISTTLRLSALNRMLREVKRDTAVFEQDVKSLDYQITTLLQKIPKTFITKRNTDALRGLVEVFQRLDASVSRVANLKGVMRVEEQKIAEMKAWLLQQDRIMEQTIPFVPPPSPALTEQSLRAIDRHLNIELGDCQDRLDLARQFWEKVLNQPEVPVPVSAPATHPQPIRKINKRDRRAERRRLRRSSQFDQAPASDPFQTNFAEGNLDATS